MIDCAYNRQAKPMLLLYIKEGTAVVKDIHDTVILVLN